MFGKNLLELANERKVIVVDLQAHGHTADIDRPLTIENMANDIAGLIKYLNMGQADLVGYSMGGMVALQTSLLHPELIRKLVMISVPYRRDGYYAEVREQQKQLGEAAAQGMKQMQSTSYMQKRHQGFRIGRCYLKKWVNLSELSLIGRMQYKRLKYLLY